MLDSYIAQYYPDQTVQLDNGDFLTITALQRLSSYIDTKADVVSSKVSELK